jgi:hypothetical protein
MVASQCFTRTVWWKDGRTNITMSLVYIRFAKVRNNAGLFAISVLSRQRGKILFHLGIQFYLPNRDQTFTFWDTWIFFKSLNKLNLPRLVFMCSVIAHYLWTQSNTLGTEGIEKQPRLLHMNFPTRESCLGTLKSMLPNKDSSVFRSTYVVTHHFSC